MTNMATNEPLLSLYRDMLRIRLVEEATADRYAEQEMRCPVHLSVGQEAIASGVCSVLRPADQIVTTHRCHAHYLAKGGDLRAMMAEIYGKATGCCGGRGGSMHLMDGAAGVLASLPIVASSIPVGVGAALTMKAQGTDNVSVVFLGDASTEEGVFHESAAFAALKKLPVIFVCENNLFAVYTRIDDRQPDRPLTRLGEAHGIVSIQADGNDVSKVRELTRQAIRRAQAGEGPTFLVLDTYRWREHCGPNYDNDIGYRTEAEFLDWKERCPLARARARLVAQGLLSDDEDAAMIAEINAEIADAFDYAKGSPFPDAATVRNHIYA